MIGSHLHSGKVRDLYEAPDGLLLMVASDRISAFDFVLPTPIPDKGRILTALSLWWFERLADIVPHHVVSTDVPAEYAGRALLCRAAGDVPGRVRRPRLPHRLRAGRLPRHRRGVRRPAAGRAGRRLAAADAPIFTPATKAAMGEHDENVSYEQVVGTVGADAAAALRDTTLAVYARARDIALERGIVVADTKLEFGRDADGRLVLADEVLTPDSSRFWPADSWQPGHAQPSYDKQFVRDWLTSPASGWDRHSGDKPPPLPDDVVERTRAKYVEAYERLTGRTFA